MTGILRAWICLRSRPLSSRHGPSKLRPCILRSKISAPHATSCKHATTPAKHIKERTAEAIKLRTHSYCGRIMSPPTRDRNVEESV